MFFLFFLSSFLVGSLRTLLVVLAADFVESCVQG